MRDHEWLFYKYTYSLIKQNLKDTSEDIYEGLVNPGVMKFCLDYPPTTAFSIKQNLTSGLLQALCVLHNSWIMFVQFPPVLMTSTKERQFTQVWQWDLAGRRRLLAPTHPTVTTGGRLPGARLPTRRWWPPHLRRGTAAHPTASPAARGAATKGL